jgi:segregation and condensation protein B
VIDDLSESLGEEPRFMKLSGAPASHEPMSFDVDQE